MVGTIEEAVEKGEDGWSDAARTHHRHAAGPVRFEGPVERVVCPGAEGDFGVLPGHERFLSALRIGPLELDPGRPRSASPPSPGIRRGARRQGHRHGRIPASSPDEIDRVRAESARERSLRQLEELRKAVDGQEHWRQYQEAYSRAITRIAVSDRFKA